MLRWCIKAELYLSLLSCCWIHPQRDDKKPWKSYLFGRNICLAVKYGLSVFVHLLCVCVCLSPEETPELQRYQNPEKMSRLQWTCTVPAGDGCYSSRSSSPRSGHMTTLTQKRRPPSGPGSRWWGFQLKPQQRNKQRGGSCIQFPATCCFHRRVSSDAPAESRWRLLVNLALRAA